MKIKYILTVLICACGLFGHGMQKNQNDQIIISGIISDSAMRYLEKEPFITFYNEYNQVVPSLKKIIPISIANNQFKVKITPDHKISYFSLGTGIIPSNANDVFLIEQGDSVLINFKDRNNVHFSGRGSEKLNYQFWSGHLMWSDSKSWDKYSTKEEIIDYSKKKATKLMALTVDYLNRDTVDISPELRQLLLINTSSSINRQYLKSITMPVYFTDTNYLRTLKHEVNFLITQQNGFVVKDPFIIKNAFMYNQYLFELNEAVVQIKYRVANAPIKDVFENIKNEYHGLLRDQLITSTFLKLYKYNSDAQQYLPQGIELIQDTCAKKLLLQLQNTKSAGVMAFNFSLPDIKGRAIKLFDLRGKVLIIETYYNGCLPCLDLAAKMEPIIRYFKNRKDVIFINLDGVSKDYKSFKKGVLSGKYGNKNNTFIWTNGLGENHPMLLFYEYYSYPNLLIIGKDGKIISVNPTKPLNEETRLKFIEMIKANL